MESKIHPIFRGNKISNYKPIFVPKSVIEFIKSKLVEKTPYLKNKLKIKSDTIGYYLNLKLD